MTSLFDACDCIIVKVRDGGGFLNVLKLHKLLYYVQAWHLAYEGDRLFDEEFQAWVHGPVSRQIYDRYPNKTLYSSVTTADIQNGFDPARIDEPARARIDSVLEVYGDLTGDQLEEMTHNEDPWKIARRGVPPSARSESVISDTDMQKYYSARIGG